MQTQSKSNTNDAVAGTHPHLPSRDQRGPEPSGPHRATLRPARQCAKCGAEIPPQATICAICERSQNHRPAEGRRVFLDWLLFLVMMSAIFGLGYMLAN